MNSLDDTLNSMEPESSAVAKTIMEGSRHFFNKYGKVLPAMFAMPLFGDKLMIEDVAVLDDDTKPIVWDKLRLWRKTHPVVAFVSEVWMSQYKARKLPPGPLPMPRDDPQKTEKVMIQLWIASRKVTIFAEITRNPDKLGEWEALFDSFFHKDGIDALGGAMMEGEPNTIGSN